MVVYRDHHTIAGLSKAGLLTKEALERAGLDIVDLDFDFGRTRMMEEYTHNHRVRRHARKTLHILNLNPEYIPECLLCHLSSLDESSYLIGQFYWELSDIAAIHECGLSLVNEIWVATEYLRDVYRRRVTVPVYVMGQAIEAHTPDAGLPGRHSICPRTPTSFCSLSMPAPWWSGRIRWQAPRLSARRFPPGPRRRCWF